MISLSYPIYDNSVSHAVVSFPPCSAETTRIDDGDGSAYLHSFFSAIVASYLSPRPTWREREWWLAWY